MRSRKPIVPSSKASETKNAHRAASSAHPGPVEPNASVGGGGVTPMPNV